MVNKFTQKAQGALSSALKLAEELGHCYIGTEHLLLGLLSQKESIASRILVLRGASESKLRKCIADSTGVGSAGSVSSRDMTPRLRQIIENAAREAERDGIRYVGTEHLLSAILNRRDCVGYRLLEVTGVSSSELKADLAAYLGSAPYRHKDSPTEEHQKGTKRSPLLSYGRDLTEFARSGHTDPVLCREAETERLIRILCRRSKNNPCLIGEPGVGKTAVIEGLAQRIVSGRVPDSLADKRIITLDISSMIAGAKFRGEFEDRLKSVIEQVRKDPSVILFVDEMHVMVGAGAAEGAIDASNILKPALARGEIRMIGATTPDEYRTHVEKDPAFERRFQPVMLEEPDQARCLTILQGLRDRYEGYHGIRISDEALIEAVRLSARYIHDRFLPDKAIDLIDEAAATLRLESAGYSHSLLSPAFCAETALETAVINGDLEEASRLCTAKGSERSALMTAEKELSSPPTLTPELIAKTVSEQTGIPCSSLLLSDGSKLTELEARLSKRIIGQPEAIGSVASAIKRGRAGLGGARPIGSFLFIGDSGVGKTELCRALADLLFDSRDALIRLDMSEYMEKHSVSRLIGAPPGYVGYGEGGLLTERVRRRPYSVVLLDEIEKAHPDVLHLLLQILEEGRLTDSTGRSVDFSNTVIAMTSNIITSRQAEGGTLGFHETSPAPHTEGLRSHPRLREIFSPELLGRIDEIILFRSPDRKAMCGIAEIMLGELAERTEERGITLDCDSSVSALLAELALSAHNGEGARPIRRYITEQIEWPLSEAIIDGRATPGSQVKVTARDGELFLSFI